MSRKFRNTETGDTMNIPQRGGQYMHANSFCISCHGVNKHYPECNKPESYAIPTSAEVPSKNSSKRKWEIFKKQFVYPKPVGYWFTGISLWEHKNLIKKRKINE